MAVTAPGSPYVETSDLVANYPGVSESLAERVDLVGVLPFANSTARGTALPTPTDGQYSYLQDTNATEYYDGAAWVAAGGGKVLQVVTATHSTATSTTSTSFVTTGLSGSITPTSATNKILVITIGGGGQAGTSSQAYFTIFRGTVAGTNLGSATSGFMALYPNVSGPISMATYDSPNTTSSVTYTLGMKVDFNTSTALANIFNTPTILMLIEVAA